MLKINASLAHFGSYFLKIIHADPFFDYTSTLPFTMKSLSIILFAASTLTSCESTTRYEHPGVLPRNTVAPNSLKEVEMHTLHAERLALSSPPGDFDAPFRFVAMPLPQYPPGARTYRVVGKVRVQFTFDSSGKVTKFVVKTSPHKALSDAVELAVERWEIVPMTKNGIPTPITVAHEFNFFLKD